MKWKSNRHAVKLHNFANANMSAIGLSHAHSPYFKWLVNMENIGNVLYALHWMQKTVNNHQIVFKIFFMWPNNSLLQAKALESGLVQSRMVSHCNQVFLVWSTDTNRRDTFKNMYIQIKMIKKRPQKKILYTLKSCIVHRLAGTHPFSYVTIDELQVCVCVKLFR